MRKKTVDLNKADELNIIESSDFLTEVIPLSNEESTINSNQSTIDDTIKTTNNESVFDQTHIDLVVHQQAHLTTTMEDVEQATYLDDDDNADRDLYLKTYSDQVSVPQGGDGEKMEEANISVVKQIIEPEVVSHEYYMSDSIEHEHRHEDSESEHHEFHSHIQIDYLQPDHFKDNQEVHSDIDEMEKEFVIPYQRNQEQTEHDESILNHTSIDDNSTTDDNDRKENSLYESQSRENIDLKVKNTILEQDNIEGNDVNTLLAGSLLSTTRTTGVEPTTYQVDSSTDQVFDNTQTVELPYTNNHLSDETNFAIRREMETDQIEEVESYQKVDSTTYDDSYILGHDGVQNDIENQIDIHGNLHQEVGDALHVYTAENVSDYQQQQFISPDSEISVDSIVETQPQYKEHELECDQHQEQHSEADSLVSSPNRPISPNYNIVSSTQHPNDEDEGGYVGDDTVVHYNDLVTMSKQSELDLLQQDQRNYADDQPYENSTLNGFSINQQLYSTIPTDDVAEMMMQRMQVMSTDIDVNNVTNIETISSCDGHHDIEQQQQQYFNGNTIFQTNELKDVDHSMNISTTSTNHHLHDSDSVYTNGFVANNVNGNSNFCLRTSENNEDDNQDENHQNNWDKTNNHYLSETAIDDIGFSNFYNKDKSSECIKTSHLTHSYPGEENDGRLPSDMMTTTPPPSATSNTPSKEMDNFSKFFIEKDQITQDVHHNSSQHCSPTEEVFDPLKSWGHPLGLPAPVPPITNHSKLHQQSTLTKRVRSADTGGKTLTTGDSNDSTLPPGPAVYLDAIWVPNYLVRVPQSLMVEFFIRIRAKLYILSGEALHPNIVESLILAKTKWNSDDVAYLCRCDANSPDASIMILPTDEPKEWIRWLETPCGRLDEQKGSDRLTANHFRLLPAANLCSTQFNAGDTAFECEGIRVEL
uniref:SJCHGC09590 protein n=1 Tax=Schistosoma japonicum TaxID=6182 RepID=Q5DCN8_SCHJA|nr:SJCHGC09590 protein [Schistosoma japonicum]